MRITLPILVGLLVVAGSAFAVNTGNDVLLFRAAPLPGDGPLGDTPIRANDIGFRADTIWYGQYTESGGEYYAIGFTNDKPSGSWTFDLATGPVGSETGSYRVIPNGEGWSVRDASANPTAYWKVIDNTLDLGAGVPPPIISGLQSLWCGADDDESNDLCWECDAGYGNDWCQRVYSEDLAYSGSGDVALTCKYFSQSEPCFDGTQVYLRRADNSELMLNPYPEGECSNNLSYTGGTWTDSIGHYSNPVTYSRTISAAEIEAAGNIKIVFEFSSDGGWSDEDCDYTTIWSGVGIDDVTINGGGIAESYNFEDGLQSWTPSVCDPIGDYVNIVDKDDCYTILDPCVCRLSNNILEMHDGLCDEGVHPVDQSIRLESPICWFGDTDLKTIFMEFDMYAEMPLINGVLHRPGWSYYPFVCEETSAIDWSPRVGQNSWNYVGDDPVCGTWRYGGTEIDQGVPVPADAQGVIAYIELLGSCEQFGIDDCSGITNFTPIYDNISVAKTTGVNAPIVDFDIGGMYQDIGSYPSVLFDPMAPGPANCVYDLNMDTPVGTEADHCGDSLVVAGPQPGSDPNKRWNARLWWRVHKRAPFQADKVAGVQTKYAIWKERVADGRDIDGPNAVFTSGLMDTVQVGFVVTRNKFYSSFHESDDDFVGEGQPENEMIWDDILYPGTEIEYFVTAYYTATPNELYYQPDTTGAFYREFEILPGLRTANVDECGGDQTHEYCVFQPAILFIDAYNRGSQFYIENALRSALHDEYRNDRCQDEDGCFIPKYRNWDRYDYWDPSSNWNAPFVRGAFAGSNNGMTLDQIIGYRGILINTGTLPGGCMQDEDWGLFSQWLTTSRCSANVNSQFIHVNGDKMGEALLDPGGSGTDVDGPAFLTTVLGANVFCNAFNGYTTDENCPPESRQFCVRFEWSGNPAGFPNAIDVDAYGSYCPNLYGFNVYEAYAPAFGNRSYNANIDPGEPVKYMEFAQVLNQDPSPSANYRTAIDGVSWHHMSEHYPPGDDTSTGWCPRSTAAIVEGSFNEICEALAWGFNVADCGDVPKLTSAEELAVCQDTWVSAADVDEGDLSVRVNRLYQNRPNPFNPTTELRFSLAQAGAVELSIYDVNGRLVKTLVDGKKDAGIHSVVWDGTNDLGNKVGSGVYWSKMKTDKYISNKQMVILK